MPLWLDLLRTPMAAPETRALRRMRLIWQGLCLSVALVVGFFSQVHAALGRAAPCLALGLIVAAGAHTWLYLRRKNAADNAFLERAGEAG
ncbi:hypothetical protein [Sphingobium yanoikuyae]|uniref:hypothetical protein n=1 Tax=Sphingobium yanoikuyae TaxID=13690 RepID=UPI000262C63C|nr:hypothetical protein [Sphingobium yanoikuyae]